MPPGINDDATSASASSPKPIISPALAAALADQPLTMARRLENLTPPVHDEDSLLHLMYQIAVEATRSMPDTDWAGVTAQFDGPPFTMGHTQQRVLVVDERQYDTDDGPCLRAMRTQKRVRVTYAQLAERWPALAETAADNDVQTILGVPVAAFDSLPAASLNLYSSTPEAFDPVDEHTTTVLAEFLGRGITAYCLHQPGHRTMRLHAALARRRTIDRAIGILLHQHPGSTPAEAEARLDSQASESQQAVFTTARDIVNAIDQT